MFTFSLTSCQSHSSLTARVAQKEYSSLQIPHHQRFSLRINLTTAPGSLKYHFSVCFMLLPVNFYSWSINCQQLLYEEFICLGQNTESEELTLLLDAASFFCPLHRYPHSFIPPFHRCCFSFLTTSCSLS